MNPRETGAIRRNALCVMLGDEPMTFRDIELTTGWGHSLTWKYLSDLVDRGYVSQVARTLKFNRPLYGLSVETRA